MRYIRIGWRDVRIGVLHELQYRAHFYVQAIQSLLGLLIVLGGLGLVFSHTRTLGGWTSDQLLALSAIYILVGGLINMVIQPSMQRFLEDVRQGTLDFVLTKPADAQALVSMRVVEVWRVLDVALGVGLLAVAIGRLGTSAGVSAAVLFGLTLVLGGTAVYSAYVILASFAFWFVRVENLLVVFQALYQAGRWPVGIYPPGLRLAITFLAPVSIAVTVPAEAVTGRLQFGSIIESAALAAVGLVLSRVVWKTGLRRYTGASA